MRRRELEAMLTELTKAVPAGIRNAGVKENACILASRLGVEALRSRGVRARPLAVKLAVHNAAYTRLAFAEERDVAKYGEAGAWTVVVGHGHNPERPGGWNGHLVVLVEERYLLDLTAGQVKRLHKDIEAKPFWLESRELARGEVLAMTNENDGCAWIYEPDPDNRSYLKAPSWSAYRVTVRGNRVISERSGPARDLPVAPTVTVSLSSRP